MMTKPFPSANELVRARYNKQYDAYGEHTSTNQDKPLENVLKDKIDRSLMPQVAFIDSILTLCDIMLTSTEQAFRLDPSKNGFLLMNLISSSADNPESTDIRDLAAYKAVQEIIGEDIMKIEAVKSFVEKVFMNDDDSVIKFSSWNEWMEHRNSIEDKLVLQQFIQMIKSYNPLVAVNYIIAVIVLILLCKGYPHAFDLYEHNCFVWSRTVKMISTTTNDENDEIKNLDDKSIEYYSNHAKISPIYEFMLHIKREIKY